MSDTPILDNIAGPADVIRLPLERLPELAREIRRELLDVVAACGGHLAPNLGTVELTVALLHTFDLEVDRMIWDTGHQAYTYKLLTGRRHLFRRLRQDDGCCGFLHRSESPYDFIGAGHAGTAISAALGFAAARDRQGDSDRRVVAVVGDGAMGCGVSLEGLNSIIETTRDFILVLNDNRMSIAPNVGAVSRYLNRIIAGEGYNRVKGWTRAAVRGIPVIGPSLKQAVHRVERAAKGLIVPEEFFAEFGLRYIGPIDGHDLSELTQTLAAVRRLREPLVVHVLTEKGHGYPKAERAPEEYHGLGRFDLESGLPLETGNRKAATVPTFSAAFGTALLQLMERDPRVVAITAGMCRGTGLKEIRSRAPERFFDVGIAEEHAAVFAAGLAAAGMRPVVAIYATFMQRAIDYVFHDVALQNLPVVFCLDRAGVVDDGPTHHGIHEMAFWPTVPNLTVAQPADADELGRMLRFLVERGRPAVMRYPKGAARPLPAAAADAPLEAGKAATVRRGDHVAIWAVGAELQTALEAAEHLAAKGIEATVVNPRFLVPFDVDLLLRHTARMPIVSLENHAAEAGFGTLAAAAMIGVPGARLMRRGWPRTVIPWGTVQEIRRKYRMTPEQIADDVIQFIGADEHGHPEPQTTDDGE